MNQESSAPSIDLGRLESLVERLERAEASIADSEERLTRALDSIRERDRAAAFDAWRRGQ